MSIPSEQVPQIPSDDDDNKPIEPINDNGPSFNHSNEIKHSKRKYLDRIFDKTEDSMFYESMI